METFDPILLSQVRLGIVAMLLARDDVTFPELKEALDVSQGNLGVHLQKLEEAGYVAVKKAFVDKKPRTTCRLTALGRRAFVQHVESLKRVARDA